MENPKESPSYPHQIPKKTGKLSKRSKTFQNIILNHGKTALPGAAVLKKRLSMVINGN
jgi:hypothetical protein